MPGGSHMLLWNKLLHISSKKDLCHWTASPPSTNMGRPTHGRMPQTLAIPMPIGELSLTNSGSAGVTWAISSSNF